MALNTHGKNVVLNTGLGGIDRLSLHTGDPGSEGTGHELSGGAYARMPVQWAAAADGSRDMASPVTFDIPVGDVTVTTIGLWDGAAYCGTVDAMTPAAQPFTGGGQLVIISAPVTFS